jgi:hypothetical protein
MLKLPPNCRRGMKKGIRLSPNPLISLVGATGFEPATPIPPENWKLLSSCFYWSVHTGKHLFFPVRSRSNCRQTAAVLVGCRHA